MSIPPPLTCRQVVNHARGSAVKVRPLVWINEAIKKPPAVEPSIWIYLVAAIAICIVALPLVALLSKKADQGMFRYNPRAGIVGIFANNAGGFLQVRGSTEW